MYGAPSYGELAYSEDRHAAVTLVLDDVGAERCWLVEIDAFSLAPPEEGELAAGFAEAGFAEVGFSEGGAALDVVQTLCYSDRGYTSRVPDNPSATWYDGRLLENLRIGRRIYGRRGIGGVTRVLGSLSLANRDGGLDTLLRDYSLPGRAIRIFVGRPDDAKASYVRVFTGVIDREPAVSLEALELALSDGAAQFTQLLADVAYAGSGGLEGGADLKGKYKPRCYGAARNVSAPMVESVKLIYQVNDGAIQNVSAVYDRGISLTQGADYPSQADLETTAPSAGQFRVWKAGGFFRLGSTPAGTVTCDIEGDATPAYVDSTADIVERILTAQASLQASAIDAGALAALDAAAPAPVHLWSGTDGRTIDDALDELLAGVHAFGGFSRLGVFTVGLIALPSGVPAASYTEEEIGDIARLPLPQPVDPIVWRVLVGYDRNYTVQADLAAGVSAARRTYAAQATRVEDEDDASIKTRHRLARELAVQGNYRDQADAAAEALRLMGLWAEPRALLRVPLPLSALTRDLNEIVALTHPRHGLAGGAEGRVLAHVIETARVELEVLT